MKDRRLGTDRRRSRQRTAVVSDVSYATVCLVRHALAGIERATCSTDRLAVWTASCGSLVESVLRPGGWESMCRLMCHCVRHIISVLITSTVDPSKRYSSRSRWTACTELCAGTQEEPYGKKSSMGSENRQRRFRWNLGVLRDALNRSQAGGSRKSSISSEKTALAAEQPTRCRRRRRKATSTQRVPRPTQSNLGGTDRIMADFRNLREHL